MDLNEIKQYLRIGHDIDDPYLMELISFSKKFIEEQTGVSYSEKDDVYKIAIKQVVAHFYDKREAVSEKTNIVVPYTMDCLIKHIGIRGAINNE